MKSFRLLYLLSAGFLILSFLLRPARETSSVPVTADPSALLTLTDIRVSDIAGFTISRGEKKIGVLPAGMSFEVLDDPHTYDQEKLAAFLYGVCHLTAARILETPEALSAYALDPPLSQISLIPSQGETVRLLIGAANPLTQERYATVEGSGTIAMLNPEISDLLSSSPEDLQDLRLFPDFSKNPQAAPDSISLAVPGQRFTLTRVAGSVSGLMEMQSPVKSRLDWEAVNNLFLIPLADLTPTRFLSDSEDAAALYGLDAPDAELLLRYSGTDVHCKFRYDPENDLCYCVSSYHPGVCSFPLSAADFLSLSYTDLLGGSLIHPSLVDIERLSLTADGLDLTVSFSGTGADLTAFTSGRLLDASAASAFFRQVTAIPVAGALTEQAAPGVKSLAVLTLSYKDGTSDILEFLPLSSSYLAVSINGVCQFATYSTIPQLLAQSFAVL